MNTIDIEQLKTWIGRAIEAEDEVTPRLVESYRAIFESHLAPVGGGEAPLGCHWCLAPAIAPMGELGPDGHPAKGLLLPPVPLPRRMWAGGEVETLAPLRIGDRVRRKTTIADIALKQGRSGSLCFFTIRHEYSTARGPRHPRAAGPRFPRGRVARRRARSSAAIGAAGQPRIERRSDAGHAVPLLGHHLQRASHPL